jgi:hypothetical protein
VQVLAPIAACWSAAIAASDPLSIAEICHDNGAGQPVDQGNPQGHCNGCVLCCLASASGVTDTPALAAFTVPYRSLDRVVWREHVPNLSSCRFGARAQARAPPFSS